MIRIDHAGGSMNNFSQNKLTAGKISFIKRHELFVNSCTTSYIEWSDEQNNRPGFPDTKWRYKLSRFTNMLLVSPLPDGKTWIIRSDFGYDVGEEGSGETINVPIGFMTDFASVPRFLWGLIPRWGKYGNAAVVHDFSYWQQSYSRKRADDIFLEGMQVLGVAKIQRNLIYFAVRSFGFLAWQKNARLKRQHYNKILATIPEKISEPFGKWQAAENHQAV